jgi:hypothetical protein
MLGTRTINDELRKEVQHAADKLCLKLRQMATGHLSPFIGTWFRNKAGKPTLRPRRMVFGGTLFKQLIFFEGYAFSLSSRLNEGSQLDPLYPQTRPRAIPLRPSQS